MYIICMRAHTHNVNCRSLSNFAHTHTRTYSYTHTHTLGKPWMNYQGGNGFAGGVRLAFSRSQSHIVPFKSGVSDMQKDFPAWFRSMDEPKMPTHTRKGNMLELVHLSSRSPPYRCDVGYTHTHTYNHISKCTIMNACQYCCVSRKYTPADLLIFFDKEF